MAPSESNGSSRETIRKQVQARREKEREVHAKESPALPALSSDDIRAAIYREEVGLAELLIKLLSGRYCLDHAAGQWHRWAGHYWEPDHLREHRKAVDELADRLEEEAKTVSAGGAKYKKQGKTEKAEDEEKYAGLLREKAKALRRARTRNVVVEMAADGEGSLGVTGEQWDCEPKLLPVENGVIELDTGRLRPGRPEEFLRAHAPTRYDSEAQCPVFETFLNEIHPDLPEVHAFLKRALGYGLLGEVREHKFLIFYGQGRNGKGVLLAALQETLGDQLFRTVVKELLLDQGKVRSSSGPRPEIMSLRGLRFATAQEPDDGQRFSLGAVKELTGGNTLVGRNPHDKREQAFRPSHLFVLETNFMPRAQADDYAFWERVLLLRFPVSFVDREPLTPNERRQDRDLKDKLAKEKEGILRWLVEGYLEWCEQGLDPPPYVRDATAEYRRDEDYIADFLEARCVVDDRVWPGMTPDEYLSLERAMQTQSARLYEEFKEWAVDEAGFKKAPAHAKFSRDMKRRFPSVKRGSVYFGGVGIRAEE
ncbi:MAG: DNA primase family protein [Oceanidesulfovibrio sp.]